MCLFSSFLSFFSLSFLFDAVADKEKPIDCN